jgi:hypothetical protein
MADVAFQEGDPDLTQDAALRGLTVLPLVRLPPPELDKDRVALLGLYGLTIQPKTLDEVRSAVAALEAGRDSFERLCSGAITSTFPPVYAISQARLAFHLHSLHPRTEDDGTQDDAARYPDLDAAASWLRRIAQFGTLPAGQCAALAYTARNIGVALIQTHQIERGLNELYGAVELVGHLDEVEAKWFAELLSGIGLAEFILRETARCQKTLSDLYGDEDLYPTLLPSNQVANLLLLAFCEELLGNPKAAESSALRASGIVKEAQDLGESEKAVEAMVGLAVQSVP